MTGTALHANVGSTAHRREVAGTVLALELQLLGAEWTVLHAPFISAVKVDIDHVVVGPTGIFTLTVVESFDTTEYRRTVAAMARREADRVEIVLRDATGLPLTVTPIIVDATPESIAGTSDAAVVALPLGALAARLTSPPRTLSADAVARVTEVVERRGSWRHLVRDAEQRRREVELPVERAGRSMIRVRLFGVAMAAAVISVTWFGLVGNVSA